MILNTYSNVVKISIGGAVNQAWNYANKFNNMQNLVNCQIDYNNITNMHAIFYNCKKLIDSPNFPKKLADMSYAYYNCHNLIGNPSSVGYYNANNMAYAFANCYNLIGHAYAPSYVENMAYAYANCYNLTGGPDYGYSTKNLSGAYYNCFNLNYISEWFISRDNGANLYDLSYTFYNCTNLRGRPPIYMTTITNLAYAFYNCSNLTQDAVCGPNVTNLYNAYYNCVNLSGIKIYASNPPVVSAETFYGISNSIPIYIPGSSWNLYQADPNWSVYSNRFQPLEPCYIIAPNNCILNLNSSREIVIPYFLQYKSLNSIPSISVISSNEEAITVSEVNIDANNIYFTLSSKAIEADSSIKILINYEEQIYDEYYNSVVERDRAQAVSFKAQVSSSPFYYFIEEFEEDNYDFKLNENGYYESTNSLQPYSYAICKVNIVTNGEYNIYFDCIHSTGDSYQSYGILSNINTPLSLNNEYEVNDKIFYSFKNNSNPEIQTIDYGKLEAGEYFIYIKFITKTAYNTTNTLQFKIRFE